ncbi:MAG: nitroreductase family protein [Bacteroidales bacterium]
MTFNELITKRQSVRKYSNQAVEKEKLVQCLEAMRLAPSASNAQPWSFVVLDEKEIREKVAKETVGPLGSFNKFVADAPVILVMVLEKQGVLTEMGGRLKQKDYPLIDIGIAAEHFCLQATELGLGTCMLGWFNEQKIKEMLQIPSQKSIGLIMTLGYAPEGYLLRKKIRKTQNEIVRFNRY